MVDLPPPVITMQETYAQGWQWWPPMVHTLRKRAEALGWEVRIGFSRRYQPGQAADTVALLDTIAVQMIKDGRFAAFFWDRLPDGSNKWSPAHAELRAGGKVGAVKHMAAKEWLAT